jgi:ubiquitin-activating enzyme E1
LNELLTYINKELGIEIDVLSIGSLMVYTSWMPKAKRDDRMPKKVTDIVTEMTQKPIEAGTRFFQLNITGSDPDSGNDIEHIPETYYYFA